MQTSLFYFGNNTMANREEIREYAHRLQKKYSDAMFIKAERVWEQFRRCYRRQDIRSNPEIRAFKDDLFGCLKPSNIFPKVDKDKFEQICEKYGVYPNDIDLKRNLETLLYFRVPTIGSIMADFSALQKEFKSISFDNNKIVVVTNDVNLEGVYLGPFAIKLNADSLMNAGDQNWVPRIEAQDPQYPGGNSDSVYTHPHVNGTNLCMGVGHDAVYQAAKSGRFFDYFQIVNNILHTYGENEGPYIEIEAWQGVSCTDCGEYYDESYVFYCDQCDHYICNACSSSCIGCGDTQCHFCDNNVVFCIDCGDNQCSSCANQCNACSDWVCDGCGIEECSECNRISCNDCIRVCESCGLEICSRCETSCDNCNSVYHKNCEYECCEDTSD